MTHASIYVAGTAVSLLLDYMDQAGLSLPAFRSRLEGLKATPRMPIATWWDILAELERAHPVPALGIRIGAVTHAHHIGMLGYLGIYSETQVQALMRFSRFQRLLHNMAPSKVYVEGDDLFVWWDPAAGISPLSSDEVLVSGLITLIRRHGVDPDAAPHLVEFPQPQPADTSAYEAFFKCPVVFGREALAVRLPARNMNQPVRTSDPHLMSLLEQQAEAMLQELPDRDALLKRLRHHISMSLQDGTPEFGEVAARMGMAERTLYRYLQERGLRYKVILNELRFQLARDYMQDPKLSLPEIALLLGYAEQSAFSRAFKEWSGETPASYRRVRAGNPPVSTSRA
ncbi:MAG TPA: AraC family transcriptional regulator ligand-binding domain-containing protein [Aquabacterium sp.]|uniref:AraC family transcriptional regulator n=1 Tax=Aquabacterium sp. TaxID=1872578 RepID=UPI002E36C1E7|nr:AraC family transcriptional regulator ligand-binding domain-containing protein [Aquabacterium sp.]HEX5356316.1 AraC family transcriptional regulator ligand-binding domain-containing protein [Aquabacterium sp.]